MSFSESRRPDRSPLARQEPDRTQSSREESEGGGLGYRRYTTGDSQNGRERCSIAEGAQMVPSSNEIRQPGAIGLRWCCGKRINECFRGNGAGGGGSDDIEIGQRNGSGAA